jgi:hypothetical protein
MRGTGGVAPPAPAFAATFRDSVAGLARPAGLSWIRRLSGRRFGAGKGLAALHVFDEPDGEMTMRLFKTGSRSSSVKVSDAPSARKARRARIGVEAMEPRLSLSGFASTVSAAHTFNPPADRIIAI